MIGSFVIDGGLHELPTTSPHPVSPLPSVGEAVRIFEMCFDHQSSQEALILYWPEMKGICSKNLLQKAILVYRWCFVCSFFSSLKKRTLGYNQKSIPKHKALGFEAFQMFCLEKRFGGTACLYSEHPWIPIISLLPSPYPSLLQNLAVATKQIEMLDNEWVEDRNLRNRTVSISQARATKIAFFFFFGWGDTWHENFAIICTISCNYGVSIYLVRPRSSNVHSAGGNRKN